MTNAEFKTLFNTLYNNINNNAAPGLSDAEISLFLNKALDEIVKSHVLGPTTTYQLGINQTSKRDVELNSLIKTASYQKYVQPEPLEPTTLSIHGKGELFTPPNVKFLIVLSEVLLVVSTDSVEDEEDESSTLVTITTPYNVVELSYTQFNKFISGVYKYPKKGLCWKLRHDDKVELVYPAKVYEDIENGATTQYNVVYVKTPQQINIASSATNDSCELPDVLHPEILQRAVELAKAAYAAETLSVQMSMGQRSE